MRTLAFTLLAALPLSAQETLQLAFPVDCTLGETCMIQQFMDREPGPGTRDFLCGPMTYDGHTGTDIRVPDMASLEQGILILAAAPGTVLGQRDSVPDEGLSGFPEGQDCGNGVLIEHDGGWQTQYCHMALGSILVTTGDVVEAGQPIGEMGFSGRTEFPHVEISVRHNGEHVDPFDTSDGASCGDAASSLWINPIPVSPGGILSVGFSGAIPDYDAIQEGTADTAALTNSAEAIVIWGFFHGGREGDIVSTRIQGPNGDVIHSQDIALERTQAQLFRATGQRIQTPLALGEYSGTVTLTRDGIEIDREITTVSVR